MSTIAETLQAARARLADSPSPLADSEILLAHVLGSNRTWLRTWPDAPVAPGRRVRFEELIARRAAGEPVAYLIGHRGFHAIDVLVTPAVLIPRPETELLVDTAIAAVRAQDADARVLDLGTGSGCVALAIAQACPDARVTGIERCQEALAVARTNAQRLGTRWFPAAPDYCIDLLK